MASPTHLDPFCVDLAQRDRLIELLPLPGEAMTAQAYETLTATTPAVPLGMLGDRRARIALAWHDCTCPEGPECRDRPRHAAGAPAVHTGLLEGFLLRLTQVR